MKRKVKKSHGVTYVNAIRAENIALKKRLRDARWENRSLRVQLYAHEVYAKRFSEAGSVPPSEREHGYRGAGDADPRIKSRDGAAG